MALENPRRRQMQRADQAGVIGMKADRHQIDVEILGLEDDVGARDGELADPALPKAAADHDALGIGPRLGLEEPAGHIGQFLRELLDRAMHQGGGADIVADQRFVEVALGDFVGGFLAEGIVAVFLQRLAQPSRILRKAPLLARSPRKPSSSFSSMLKLSTSTDGRRVAPWRAMPVVVMMSSAILPCPCRISRRQRAGNPLVS